MTHDVQLDEPARELLDAVRIAAPGWLRRITLDAAMLRRSEPLAADFTDEIDEMSDATVVVLLDRLHELLVTDVDAQTTNPLSLFRDAVSAPTALLTSHGVPTPPVDGFAAERFPHDVYRLGPATWSDVDPSLHDPGITWGAWKAMTVLRRRRDEGVR
ncbi:MAG: hypothetical protein ABIP17_14685 [Ilumatobacteraceae bacterium]